MILIFENIRAISRKNETHQVDFANIERFRKSSIIYIQSLLNEP